MSISYQNNKYIVKIEEFTVFSQKILALPIDEC